ncbi:MULTISPECIES: glycoside hydrolase N-terminal domain-containing protein [unclassified Streptomyces]|uniref:glycoside hydrolase N-terminal domain-containing protein n=1 Tax=unclassified Streptomyces TaxID=2593676 RepID=UPI001660DEAC|nr:MULTISPECIES: glycoside hydrolase N-terminal domain-containing protein [unclassified Streptomyces]MBD0708238.1 hypothetical protein [Streptomyces sp. CBMA291]MBD0717807.1 hypothetical protein [Streptomyces sp. CBMA370]
MIHGTWEPAPAARWQDAYPVGNGRHRALVFGDPEDDRVILTHHSLHQGEHPQDRPFPGLRTRVQAPSGGPARPVRRSLDFATGVVTGECGERRGRVFVSRTDDVLVQYVTAPGPAVEVGLDHRLPGAPAGLGSARGIATARRETVLTLRATHPDGGPPVSTGVTLLLADTGRTTLTATGVRIEGAGALLLLTRVRRHGDAVDTEKEVRALRALLTGPSRARTAADPRGPGGPGAPGDPGASGGPGALYARLLDRHTAPYGAAYRRLALDLGADPAERALSGTALLRHPGSPALQERLFAASRHQRLSGGGRTAGPCGLWSGERDPVPAAPPVGSLVLSAPDRLVLLPAPPCPYGRITGVRTRFGARVDLAWAPGAYHAVIRPGRDAEVELRTPGGRTRLVLRAGEDHTVRS